MAKEFTVENGTLKRPGRRDALWRVASFDPSAMMFSMIDARPRSGIRQLLFAPLVERYSPASQPEEALADLLLAVNGSFFTYSGPLYGDGAGFHQTDRNLRTRHVWTANMAPSTKPYVPCRWWFGTQRDPATGLVTPSWGRGGWPVGGDSRECDGKMPSSAALFEMLIGGGVLLHDPHLGLDATASSAALYGRNFNKLNHGFWKRKSGDQAYNKPFGAQDPSMANNPLGVKRSVARWAVGPSTNRLKIVSVGQARDPSGMRVHEFARFVAVTHGMEAAVMFDGSAPHCFAAAPDTKTVGGRPVSVFATPLPRENTKSFAVVLRRVSGSITGILDFRYGNRFAKTGRKATDSAFVMSTVAPFPTKNPSDPPPDIPIEIELRRVGKSVPSVVRLFDVAGSRLAEMDVSGVRFDRRNRWSGRMDGWKARPKPGSIEEVRLCTYFGRGGNERLSGEHRLRIAWKAPEASFSVFTISNENKNIISRVPVKLTDADAQIFEGHTKHGIFGARVTSGRCQVELAKGDKRYRALSIEALVYERNQTDRIYLEPKTYLFPFTVIDGATHDPIEKALADFRTSDSNFRQVMTGADGRVVEQLPFWAMQVVLSAPGYETRDFEFGERLKDTEPFFLKLYKDKSVGMVRGRVFDKTTGEALINVRATLKRVVGAGVSNQTVSETLTDTDGRFSLGYLTVGVHEVTFEKFGFTNMSGEIEIVPDLIGPDPFPDYVMEDVRMPRR